MSKSKISFVKILMVSSLALLVMSCGKKTVESGALTQTPGYPTNPGYPYPYPSGYPGQQPGQFSISVMQYAYSNPYLQFPAMAPANPQDHRALYTGLQVQAGDRLILYPNSQGGWGVSQTRWGIFQSCSSQVGLAGQGGRGALWASDGVRTYAVGMGGTHVIQNSGMLTIGFDVDDDGQRRCFWIPPSLVLQR